MRKSIIRIILAVCVVVSFSFFVGLTVNAETTGVVTDGIETIPLGESASTPIELTDGLVNYRLRCTTAVVDGNLVLTADPAGTSSMKVRLG
ncbi:MAG: hypothetical protein II982_02165, partial [Clostridia bacterium]|nr:hypothetical protein [Clostridia bacterium]